MKSHIFILVALSVFYTASAQEGLHVAILGRAQSKTIGGDFFVKNFAGNNFALKKEFSIGYQAGLAVGYGFTDNIGVNIGAFYSTQGQRYAEYNEQAGDLAYSFKREVALNYLKLPVHAVYIYDAAEDISFSAFAGFYYAMLLSYQDKTSFQYSSTQEMLFNGTATVSGDNYKWEYTDHGAHYLETFHMTSQPYQKSDFGISAGAGAVFKLSDMIYLPVMATYQQGLTDIKNHSAAEVRYSKTTTYWDETTDANKSEKYSSSTYGVMIGLKLLIDEIAGY